MNEVVITAGVRTAQGKFAGALINYEATQLGGFVIKEVITRAGIKPDQVNEVIMGNVVSAGQGQNVARQAMIAAGLPYEIGAFHVDKVCGSSLKAIVLATQAIKIGDAESLPNLGQRIFCGVQVSLHSQFLVVEDFQLRLNLGPFCSLPRINK